MTIDSGTLYVVPTPLGNLSDISERSAHVLKNVDWVAAEDTRHSQTLLRHLGSRARTLPAHEHNEHEAAHSIITHLAAGHTVALISDAGTPAISDPGARVVAQIRNAGFKVTPLPGPCAAITALSAAGLLCPHFLFYGFLPAKAGQRDTALASLKALPYTLIFYEAPHRIVDTIRSLSNVFEAERTLVFARELTKQFEEIHTTRLQDALSWVAANPHRQRGEFVLIVSGAPPSKNTDTALATLKLLLEEGLPVKQAAKLAHAITGAPKNEMYAHALALRAEASENSLSAPQD